MPHDRVEHATTRDALGVGGDEALEPSRSRDEHDARGDARRRAAQRSAGPHSDEEIRDAIGHELRRNEPEAAPGVVTLRVDGGLVALSGPPPVPPSTPTASHSEGKRP